MKAISNNYLRKLEVCSRSQISRFMDKHLRKRHERSNCYDTGWQQIRWICLCVWRDQQRAESPVLQGNSGERTYVGPNVGHTSWWDYSRLLQKVQARHLLERTQNKRLDYTNDFDLLLLSLCFSENSAVDEAIIPNRCSKHVPF